MADTGAKSNMRVLVVGGGGREHALVQKLSESQLIDAIWCFPGNAGISQIASIPDLPKLASAHPDILAEFAEAEDIDLTIVGPENYLADGIVDVFRSSGLTIFGPTQRAAQIESSKVFAKELMRKYHISTAAYEVFTDYESAEAYIKNMGAPIVIKADGLAAGKGVIVARDVETALKAAKTTLSGQQVGDAGRRIVIEEFLQGQEVSILALCDGTTCLPLVPSQDHKAVGECDEGPNTGGMGAYSPIPMVDQGLEEAIYDTILIPTLRALQQEGIDYTGVLYAGLMLTDNGPKVIEFNCRFGDPETQVILPRLKTDLAVLLLAASQGRLASFSSLEWDPRACVCVIAASGGYPGAYNSGFPISGLEAVGMMSDIYVFHAGTSYRNKEIVTAGGRVLGISALGEDISKARERAYTAMDNLDFEGMYYRTDIGWRALTYLHEKLND
jgi:phosphoribosylamine--glycine ligase